MVMVEYCKKSAKSIFPTVRAEKTLKVKQFAMSGRG